MQIPIINDMIPEVQKCFRIMLTVITPLPGIILTPDNATVVINSDDGKCQKLIASVLLGNEVVN